jgi:hypothetical protein
MCVCVCERERERMPDKQILDLHTFSRRIRETRVREKQTDSRFRKSCSTAWNNRHLIAWSP